MSEFDVLSFPPTGQMSSQCLNSDSLLSPFTWISEGRGSPALSVAAQLLSKAFSWEARLGLSALKCLKGERPETGLHD